MPLIHVLAVIPGCWSGCADPEQTARGPFPYGWNTGRIITAAHARAYVLRSVDGMFVPLAQVAK